MNDEQTRAALDAAAKQLSYRALSTAALRDKLLDKGHDPAAVDAALAWLTERRLLDDTAYAESVVRSCTRRGYGAARIRQELTRRGLDRPTAEAALLGYATDPAQLHALLDKRLRGDVSDRKAVERAVAFLQRRGFSWGEIRAALDGYGQSLPDGDNDDMG
ncbi:MAG: regulatory protein RecX [Eubacteriales bacterium]|nr:regulatory protein RecX [Eubacteriales bacterium]